jgi:hypothetical protein
MGASMILLGKHIPKGVGSIRIKCEISKEDPSYGAVVSAVVPRPISASNVNVSNPLALPYDMPLGSLVATNVGKDQSNYYVADVGGNTGSANVWYPLSLDIHLFNNVPIFLYMSQTNGNNTVRNLQICYDVIDI